MISQFKIFCKSNNSYKEMDWGVRVRMIFGLDLAQERHKLLQISFSYTLMLFSPYYRGDIDFYAS